MRRTRIGVGAVTLLVCLTGGARIGLATVTALQPADDTYVDTDYPDTVQTGYVLYADYSPIGPRYRHSLLKFDLSSIPSDAIITATNLHMYALDAFEKRTFLYRTANDAWDEDTTTWNSYEPYMASGVLIGDAQLSLGNEGWIDWSIDLASWDATSDMADGAITFLLKGDSANQLSFGPLFLSKEDWGGDAGGPHIPYLEITWTPEPTTVLGLLALGGVAASRRRKRPVG